MHKKVFAEAEAAAETSEAEEVCAGAVAKATHGLQVQARNHRAQLDDAKAECRREMLHATSRATQKAERDAQEVARARKGHWAAIAEAKECVSSKEALAAQLEAARAEIARLRNLLVDDHPEP